MFNGTDWVDPCDCNIHIRRTDNTWKLLDPRNCPTYYWTGTSWCPITCGCNCPEGYTYNPTTDACEEFTIVPATPSGGTTYNVVSGDNNASYNQSGARLYNSINSGPFPYNGFGSCGTSTACYIVKDNNGLGATLGITAVSAATNDIFNSQGSSSNGRLNISGLWAQTGASIFPGGEWLTVRFCVDIGETKTYIFALAGDNQVKADITSTTFNGGVTNFNLVNIWASASPTGAVPDGSYVAPFTLWHMFPITLPAGSHIFELSGWNIGTSTNRGFAGEIYDISVTDMQALMASTTVTPTDLEPFIIFTTRDLVTSPPLVVPGPGETITWSCPPGSTFSECYGVPSCVISNSIPCGGTISEKTEINIWFDNSGSMNGTLAPLNTMKTTLLQACLLPIYNNDVTLYNERVKVLNMFDSNPGGWNYNERFIRCMAEGRNFQRTVDTSVDQVINLTFADESNPYGYGGSAPFLNTSRTTQYDADIATLRANVASFPYNLKGCAFRVNTGPNAYPGFRGLTEATFVNSGAYAPPYNVSDFVGTNFTYELDTTASSTAAYYMAQVVSALNTLGIPLTC